MQERWVDIDGYDGLYQVSDLGRVRSLRFGKVRIMKPYLNRAGYYTATLSKNGERKVIAIHRLIALAFIPNDRKLNEVDHIDANRTNNNIENLRWVTHSENMAHAVELGNMKGAKARKREERSRATTPFVIEGIQLNTGSFQEIMDKCDPYRCLQFCIARRMKRSEDTVRSWAIGRSRPRTAHDMVVVSRIIKHYEHVSIPPETLFPSK